MSDTAQNPGDELAYSAENAVIERINESLDTPPVGVVLIETTIDATYKNAPDQKLIDNAIVTKIRQETGSKDIVLLLGPDQVVIVKQAMIAPAEAEGCALRIQARLQPSMIVGEGRLSVQTAIGVATSHSSDTAEALFGYAVHALNDARMLGGERVVAFDDQDRDLLA